MTSRFSKEKHDDFNAKLGALINEYLNQDDVDAMALAAVLERRSKELAFIGWDERQRFKQEAARLLRGKDR